MSVDLATEPVASLSEEPALSDEYLAYRALSVPAMAGFVLGLLSVLATFGWSLSVIPVMGIGLSWRGLRSIRRNPTELTGVGFARAGLALSAVFLVGSWTLLTTIYLTEVPEGFERMSFTLLDSDPNTPDDLIPPSAEALVGKRVFVKGYIHPSTNGEKMKEFVLVRDNGVCCFGATTPRMSDMILVKMQGDLRVDYTTRTTKLAGTFRIDATQKDELGTIAYQLEAEYAR